MKIWKKYLALMLALVLCLSLAACGGTDDNGGDGSVTPPESFEGMVKDTQQLVDYSMYKGIWSGEDGSQLVVALNDDGDEMRFSLYDVSEELTASGYIQMAQEYSADYFYNEHDGVAHHSWMDEDGTLHVDSFGDYVYVGAVEGGDGNGDSAAGDYAALAGAWFMDADAAAESIIEIDEYGNWSLAERPGGDGDPTEVDCGTLEVNSADEGQYFAVSTMFDDVVYDMTVIGDDAMYWGGENDYYQKMA